MPNFELYKEITRASYQATAKEFAQNVADLAPVESIEKFIKLLPSKAKIIDIGCGSGRDTKIFTHAGVDVLGIDFSSSLIEIAKMYAPLAKFQLMDIEAMSLPSAMFDGAWAACSLGHIPKNKILNVLNQIHILLKEEGYFYLALKKGRGEVLEKDERYTGNHQKFWSFFEEDELISYIENAGFNIVDFKLIGKKYDYQTHSAFRVFCKK
jgi:SAM-dependent methyltransferase